VGVAATAGVPFGGDQHVLAERWQVMAAERAAVRRGLAIRRAAHRPPWDWRKSRHRSIVAASRPAARGKSLTAAIVVVGVGVSLALAKIERDRRMAAARLRRERRPSLLVDELPAPGLRRVILGQLDLAIELLEDHPGEAGDQTVHELRKTLKRLRALMRLLRHALGSKRFARENAALRDCGQRLAGARDAEVMVDTLDALCKRHPAKLAGSRGVRRLRAELLVDRERAATDAIRDPWLREAVAGELRAIRRRVAAWEPSAQGDRRNESIGSGLERLYRQGHRALRTARRRQDVEALHEWRKRVKDLRYAAEALDAKRLRRVARRADRVGETLGEEHDLALLARAVRSGRRHFVGERKTRRAMRKLIARRRRKLRRRALRDGERLYRRGPKRFVRRLGDL
jgi:CHAD domain-containing protein